MEDHARSRGGRPLHQPMLAAPSSPTNETCWPPHELYVAQEALPGTFSRRHINRLGAPEARRRPYASSGSILMGLEGLKEARTSGQLSTGAPGSDVIWRPLRCRRGSKRRPAWDVGWKRRPLLLAWPLVAALPAGGSLGLSRALDCVFGLSPPHLSTASSSYYLFARGASERALAPYFHLGLRRSERALAPAIRLGFAVRPRGRLRSRCTGECGASETALPPTVHLATNPAHIDRMVKNT